MQWLWSHQNGVTKWPWTSPFRRMTPLRSWLLHTTSPFTFIDIRQVDTLGFLFFCDTCHCQSEPTSNNTFSKNQFVENNKFLIICSFVEVIPTFFFWLALAKFHPKMKTFIPPIVIVWITWPMKSIPRYACGISPHF
jgi:hypothetical protein